MRKKTLLWVLVFLALTAVYPCAYCEIGPVEAGAQVPLFDITVDEQAFRGVDWEMTLAETAEAEGGKAGSKTVTVTQEVRLYELDVNKLSYRFEDGEMTSRVFTMKRNNRDAFSSIFYSLCLRYGIPISASARKAVWQSNRLNITIERGDALTVTYMLDRQE